MSQNQKRVRGRKRTWIDHSGLTDPPTETMLLLARLKNEGHSWRSLAEELNAHVTGKGISHSMLRRVALGHCTSSRIDYALGIREAPPPVPVTPCPSCGRIHRQYKSCDPAPGKQRKPNKRRARLNELAQQAGYETWGKLETAVLYGRAKVIQEGD